ncbi:glycoside hydrolase family 88 protein [Duganella sp. BJB488]|uniref:glycoside hydrolase family 88/105 protein n=1 Tax=unclassified Duganella TaxID=2636909 RepID=UPI000E355759|nr:MULTISPECIES: glycoside hydrolase family 88 protein [unclassified Duganella]RFP14021.1 glycoside hydrolase family 88 protein [Duganella sp. BJB489]RFP17395.1 glycoside hydrolase family 88 protein [Duganella sp. BJB488]RFP31815.1 glycoside hydrolase family 88 protein [Duganella sp. BJB480]
MNFKKYAQGLLLLLAVTLGGCATPAKDGAAIDASRAEVVAIIDQVNGHWQRSTPAQQWAFWHVAAYQTGNMAAYQVTHNEAYRRYAEAWAEHNQWMGARAPDKSRWQHTYGETDDHVLFGDWQICFQTYTDLYKLAPDPRKIARAREVMEYEMSTARDDYWWWSDGLYMVMPVMTKLYGVTGDRRYLEKLHQYFEYANSIMYDPVEHLYYRDAKYVYPAHASVNGKKDFWSRGDGWVFAALARVLDELPADDPHRADYVARFKDMAQALKRAQQPEGYWTRSLLDPQHAPGPETSGTAFFTYGYLWGINHGVLARDEYLPVARKGWHYLSKVALQPDGRVGYVQPIGDRAIPGQVVDQNSTADFGVGAFLLASAELVRLLDQK